MEKKEKKEKKSRYRFSYLNDFKLNDNGEYEYQGPIFHCDLKDEERLALLKKAAIVHAGLLAVIPGSGFLPFEAMVGSFYVIVPYVFECFFSFFLIICLYTVWKKKELREYEYQRNAQRIGSSYLLICFNALIGLIGSSIYCLIRRPESILISLLYISARLITAGISYHLNRMLSRLTYSKADS